MYRMCLRTWSKSELTGVTGCRVSWKIYHWMFAQCIYERPRQQATYRSFRRPVYGAGFALDITLGLQWSSSNVSVFDLLQL